MTESTDLELLALVHACDEHAMAVIFDRHSTVVYSVALQVSGLPFEAERVLQEVLMAVWRVPTDVLATGLSLKQWVGLEARRVAVQMKRSYYPDPVCDSSAGSSRSDAKGLLTMAFFEGKTLPQLCGLTGDSPEAVGNTLAAAISELRTAGPNQRLPQAGMLSVSAVGSRARLLESDPKKTIHRSEVAATGAAAIPAGTYRRSDIGLPNSSQHTVWPES